MHPYLLEKAIQIVNMPQCQQRHTQPKEEHFSPSTPNSPNHEHQGKIEARFEENEDKKQVFLIEMMK